MSEIERYDVNEQWAHSGIIRAGDFCFLGYCAGNPGGTIEEQINAAFDQMEERLAMVGLTLENVVQMDCLFRDVWNIPVMEKIIKERFNGKYPEKIHTDRVRSCWRPGGTAVPGRCSSVLLK